MDKYILTPLKTSESEIGRALIEKNTSVEGSQGAEIEVIHQKVIEKPKPAPTQPLETKSLKLKKFRVKKSRGEKRKLPDKSDLKKVKRKKKEEKSSELNDTSFNEILLSPNIVATTPCNKSATAENDSDVENSEKPTKQKLSRKKKVIATKCKETFDVLLKLGSEALGSLEKSLKLVKTHNLLEEKYMSVDVLLDLVSLALGCGKGLESEQELSLLMITSKCLNGLSTTPKRVKTRQSLVPVPDSGSPNTKLGQEEAPPSALTSKKEILEKEIMQNPELEVLEETETNVTAECSDKSFETAVEKSGKNFCITNYFKKLKRTVEERDKNERFSCFTTKTDMFLAPKLGGELTGERRLKFEEDFEKQNSDCNYFTGHTSRLRCNKKLSNEESKSTANHSSSVALAEIVKSSSLDAQESGNSGLKEWKRASLIRIDKPKIEPNEAVGRSKAKLFQFHDNRRPPYWGTWRRKSESVKARNPFGRDKMFNYEVDSDEEWEEEEEPGESLHGSDDEKEPEEDYEVDNDFFVPHGYLSDDENPEKENLSPKAKLDLLEEQFTSEQKQKSRKMTPIVFGAFWLHKGLPPEGTLYQDLQIERLQYVPWTTIPVQIDEEYENPVESELTSSQTKKSKQKIFPTEEIPALIKMIHGSPQNSDHLARKFLLYWDAEKLPNRPGLTKVCVQKKIKELAAWQASHEKGKMCWLVPKETREEFGAEVDTKTPEKKPRKCFIWKFVRKAEKNPGGNPPPSTPHPVEPEVVILES